MVQAVSRGVVPMGIDKLIRAAEAAGYAMANSEDLLVPAQAPKSDPQPLRPAEPVTQRLEQRDIAAAKPHGGIREWWFALSNRATA